MEWIDNCVSFRGGLKRSQGEFPIRKALLSLVLRGAKYGV